MATNRLLRLRFEAIFICCLGVATSFGTRTELGRIVLPANSSTQTASAGLQKLSGRNGLLYIPTDHAEPLPLLILLHKAGGSASEWFSASGSYAPYADRGRFIILAPESPGQSWGTGPKTWGYHYLAINRALEEAFAFNRSNGLCLDGKWSKQALDHSRKLDSLWCTSRWVKCNHPAS